MDIKLIGNAYGAAEYTAAYVSKSEPDTSRFTEAISKALERCLDQTDYVTTLRRVANASISVREVSAQEALWILLNGLPMYGKSRTVLKVKCMRHSGRHYKVDMDTCLRELVSGEITTEETNDIHLEQLEAAYAARPVGSQFDQMTYKTFCENYE